ncbi:hypothetical protein ABW21_db0205058 [Orbilia brochopaga]|nr:hypothetical protein ABW21_db0205058 [Drechslerella brochopaga]
MTKKELSASDLATLIGLPLVFVTTGVSLFEFWRRLERRRRRRQVLQPTRAASPTLSPSRDRQENLEMSPPSATAADASPAVDAGPLPNSVGPPFVVTIGPSSTPVVDPSPNPTSTMPEIPAAPAPGYVP